MAVIMTESGTVGTRDYSMNQWLARADERDLLCLV